MFLMGCPIYQVKSRVIINFTIIIVCSVGTQMENFWSNIEVTKFNVTPLSNKIKT